MNYSPRTVDIIAILFTLGYFAVLLLSFFRPFPESNKDVLNFLLGILSAVMLKIVESLINKDAANSATATAIHALKADTTPKEVLMKFVPLLVVGLVLLISGCASMNPEQLAANAKDKNAIAACGTGTGPWGKVTTVYVDTNKINDNQSVSVDAECKVNVTGSKAFNPNVVPQPVR